MQRLLLIGAAILTISCNVLANSNREPSSPSGHYEFSLKMIQDSVRSALLKADLEIQRLSAGQELEGIARLYFHDYLEKIASYNETQPQLVDLVESYKTELVNAYVLKEFKENYPHLIYDRSAWMFNSVGGIYANTIILYCSPKEYIVLWGTTLRADNKFSGYYPFMNEFDVMVRGRMESHDLDAPGHAAVVYSPKIQEGKFANTVDTSNLIPSNVRSYNLDAHTYMISYAQGNIVKAFIPGAIMPGIFTNQDWGGMSSHLKEGFKAYVNSKKRPKSKDWTANPNYRALWIIDEYRKAAYQK